MDVGSLIVLCGGVAFLVLAILFVRKLARGQVGDLPETTTEDAEVSPETEPPAVPTEAPPAIAAPQVSNEVASLRRGLEKTRKGFMARINELLFKGIDENLADDLEAILVGSDVGVRTTENLLRDLRDELSRKELRAPEMVRERLREKIARVVDLPLSPLAWDTKPLVVMVIGVNGVGKTTTIGKLAARFVREGKKVVLAAGDTFRAAAVEQLEIWGERSGAEVVKGDDHADPSSVVYDAIQRARSTDADICICDTAGRLHTKVNLMKELEKLRRVMDKALPGAPHEVLMVLDATTGQNGIAQARQFKEAVEVGSIALTKLDGTAKGGVVVAICDELALPVRYIGVGEKVEDLRDFHARTFVDALFDTTATADLSTVPS